MAYRCQNSDSNKHKSLSVGIIIIISIILGFYFPLNFPNVSDLYPPAEK